MTYILQMEQEDIGENLKKVAKFNRWIQEKLT